MRPDRVISFCGHLSGASEPRVFHTWVSTPANPASYCDQFTVPRASACRWLLPRVPDGCVLGTLAATTGTGQVLACGSDRQLSLPTACGVRTEGRARGAQGRASTSRFAASSHPGRRWTGTCRLRGVRGDAAGGRRPQLGPQREQGSSSGLYVCTLMLAGTWGHGVGSRTSTVRAGLLLRAQEGHQTRGWKHCQLCRKENTDSKKHRHPYVHPSVIDKSQGVDATCPSLDRWRETMWSVCPVGRCSAVRRGDALPSATPRVGLGVLC